MRGGLRPGQRTPLRPAEAAIPDGADAVDPRGAARRARSATMPLRAAGTVVGAQVQGLSAMRFCLSFTSLCGRAAAAVLLFRLALGRCPRASDAESAKALSGAERNRQISDRNGPMTEYKPDFPPIRHPETRPTHPRPWGKDGMHPRPADARHLPARTGGRSPPAPGRSCRQRRSRCRRLVHGPRHALRPRALPR
jgi:hypothetical protein